MYIHTYNICMYVHILHLHKYVHMYMCVICIIMCDMYMRVFIIHIKAIKPPMLGSSHSDPRGSPLSHQP